MLRMDPLIVQLYRTNAVENMSNRLRRFYNRAVICTQGIVKKLSLSKSEINECKMEIETSELRTGSSDEYVKEQENKIALIEKKMDHVRIVRKNIIESKTVEVRNNSDWCKNTKYVCYSEENIFHAQAKDQHLI